MIRLSNMVQSIQPSLTRKLFNMAKEYDDVIDFTLGDPDFITPENVREAGCRAIMEGRTKYSQNAGLLELRSAICEDIRRENGMKFDPATEVMVSVGGMEALYLTLLSTVNPGDEVIIPAPYWINYVHMVIMCGGKPVVVDSHASEGFAVSVEEIRKAITPRTTAIIINTPCNPSGMVIGEDILREIAATAIEHDLFVISDEVYKNIIYDGAQFRSIVTFEGMRERTVLVNSFSKKFSMTGWRVGYVVAPAHLIANMLKLQENVVACAPLPSQYAAIEALRGSDTYTRQMVEGFRRRRDVLVEGINAVDKLCCRTPQATFYAFVNICKTDMGSEAFAYELLRNARVAVVPGITYGECCEGFIRIAYTMDEERIREGVRRIAAFVNGL